MTYVHTFDPRILLGDRLELTLYGMFVEAYLQGRLGVEESMYKKFVGHFLADRIHTPSTFVQLIESVRSEGLDPRRPAYVNPSEYSLWQGTHRCAIAIQVGIREVPYSLSFRDSRVDDSVFRKVFTKNEFKLLLEKRAEYISRCDPAVALNCRLRVFMRERVNSFGRLYAGRSAIPTLKLYESYEKLGIPGRRSSKRRIEIYGLPRYLDKSMRVLDIGCNVGFLALSVGDYALAVDAFDPNPDYIQVAKEVAAFTNAANCRFYIAAVEEFRPEEPYDFLISAAIHRHASITFWAYVQTISQWVKPGGHILFESHQVDKDANWPAKRALLASCFDIVEAGVADDVADPVFEGEVREFLILKKREPIQDFARQAEVDLALQVLLREEPALNTPHAAGLAVVLRARGLARSISESFHAVSASTRKLLRSLLEFASSLRHARRGGRR